MFEHNLIKEVMKLNSFDPNDPTQKERVGTHNAKIINFKIDSYKIEWIFG